MLIKQASVLVLIEIRDGITLIEWEMEYNVPGQRKIVGVKITSTKSRKLIDLEDFIHSIR